MRSPLKPIPLCRYRDRTGTNELTAVVDELTLTYTVMLGDGTGAMRPLRRHLPALRAARRWALAHRDAALRS